MTSKKIQSLIDFFANKLSKFNISKEDQTQANFFKTETMTETIFCKKHKNDLKINYFYKDKAKLRVFLIQLKLAFAMNKEKYTDQPSKILIAAVYLRGLTFA
jgi:hypothetical protein